MITGLSFNGDTLKKYKDNPCVLFVIRHYPLIVALIVTSLYLFPRSDMVTRSGDSADIWKTIITWHSNDVYGSYVLYKGFESVYPYVWFYDWSVALGLDQLFFIKCYYIVMFALSTTFLLPKIFEKLTGVVPKNYKILILFVICFFFWIPASALTLQVDLPSLFYFLILVLLALNFDKYSRSILYWISLGFMMGLNLCSSGQYTLPVVAVAIYLIIQMFKTWKEPTKRINWVFCIPLIVVALGIKECNEYFLDTIVEGLKANGAWIPTSEEWLESGFLRLMPIYRQGFSVKIYDGLCDTVMYNYYGEFYELNKQAISDGAVPITMWDYLDIVIHEPFAFIVMYSSKFLLVLSPDRGSFNIIPLLISYTLLFIAMRYIVLRYKERGQLFTAKIWIIAAFFFAVLPCIIITYEPRYAFQFQGLIFATAICTSWAWLKPTDISDLWKKKEKDGSSRINYTTIVYILFVISCFVLIAMLYANSANPNCYLWCSPKYHWWQS